MFNLNFFSIMARNKVLERAKVTMPSGRNAVDLSQEKTFSQLSADLNVCYCQPCVAGTKGKISRKAFTRTADVVSPAFHRVTEHFDFFVVPIHSLWRYWENWKVNINDMQDTNLVQFIDNTLEPDLALPSYTPRMDFSRLLQRLNYVGAPATLAEANRMARLGNDVLRLAEQLRYSQLAVYQYQATSAPAVMNLFKAAAYQKCYFDHYRNTAYESNNPYAYSLDWLTADSQHNGLLNPPLPSGGTWTANKDSYVASELFKMRRVNYRNDYFHNIYPALNYVVSSPNGINWVVPSSLGGLNQSPAIDISNGNVYPSAPITVAGSPVQQPFTVQNIRALFALDKLMRASAYAPKHVRDQYKALYGVDGVEDFDMKSERIGSFQSDVVFQEVTNMAQSASYNLGDLGAKGLGGDDKSQTLNFYCKYDSIVIGLHYFLPRASYDNMGVDPWNVNIAREDFYIKAFENLGLRPIYLSALTEGTTPSEAIIARGSMIGWTVPNFVYKIKPDLNEGAFKLNFFEVVSGLDANNDPISDPVVSQSQLSTYVPHTLFDGASFVSNNTSSAEWFKAAPEDLDSLFAVSVPADHQITYFQFFGKFRISVAAVIPMSIQGQPNL